MKKLWAYLISWLPILCVIAYLSSMMEKSIIPYLVLTYFTGFIGFCCLIFNRRINRRIVSLLLFTYFFTELTEYIIIGNVDVGDIARSAFIYCIVIVMFVFPHTYHQGFIQFYFVIISIGAYLISGRMPQELFEGYSHNFISVILLLSVLYYFIGLDNSKRNISTIDLIPPTLSLIVSIWARGRGGVIAIVFLFLIILYVFLKQNRQKSSIMFTYSTYLIIAAVLYFLYYVLTTYEDFINLQKFEQLGMGANGRDEIWISYFNKVEESIIYMLFGAPLADISEMRAMDMNPHNSYILLHAYNGIFMTVIFFVLFAKCIISYSKHNLIFCALTISFFFRGLTDVFLFGTFGMPAMLYLVLKPYVLITNKK